MLIFESTDTAVSKMSETMYFVYISVRRKCYEANRGGVRMIQAA
jgi:hypothetical protein